MSDVLIPKELSLVGPEMEPNTSGVMELTDLFSTPFALRFKHKQNWRPAVAD